MSYNIVICDQCREAPCTCIMDTIAEQQSEASNIPGPRKLNRLSGAAKKKLKKLLQMEMSVEEAFTLCRKSWEDIWAEHPHLGLIARKRRPEEESPQAPQRKIPRMDFVEEEATPPQFSDNEGSCRVGIRNTEPMTEEQMRLVHREIITAITSVVDANLRGVPKFAGFSFRTGWILVTCSNQGSQHWLVDTILKMKPWPEARLSIIPESELPRIQIATTFLPRSEAANMEVALQLLWVQNEELNPKLWRVLNTKEEAAGCLVTFALDDPSVEALRAMRCQANFGVKTIVFKIKERQKQKHSNMADPPSSTSSPEWTEEGGLETLEDPRESPAFRPISSPCAYRVHSTMGPPRAFTSVGGFPRATTRACTSSGDLPRASNSGGGFPRATTRACTSSGDLPRASTSGGGYSRASIPNGEIPRATTRAPTSQEGCPRSSTSVEGPPSASAAGRRGNLAGAPKLPRPLSITWHRRLPLRPGMGEATARGISIRGRGAASRIGTASGRGLPRPLTAQQRFLKRRI